MVKSCKVCKTKLQDPIRLKFSIVKNSKTKHGKSFLCEADFKKVEPILEVLM